MKVLVVYGHPHNKSFNHAILEEVETGLKEAGHEVDVVDLYGIEFDPVLSSNDFGYLQQGTAPPDVKVQQEKVTWAEGIIVIHPIWWESHPAIVKGWFDRVLSLGFAYIIDETGVRGLLKTRKAMFITTTGGSEKEVLEIGHGVNALKRIFKDMHAFEFCGIPDVQHENFYEVVTCSDDTRKEYLKRARELARNF
ncbi:MAG TPA: NAD(P)H-dependent oxidoreductase [Thermodesulfobacteriota bacterium]|nr:NAD(P)H-dependent oxidoreductase [Deltaproteobacteria bacterium]HOC38165.1 NAD(P)H-dependent oxidoreductase [Thermodesulfobacteriota bacterium]